jgi:6-phosphogluconate dehydrogenase
MVAALDDDPGLSKVAGYAEDSGEGRWTVEAGIEHAVATPAITAALYARFVSRQDDSPAMQAVAAMRNQFGGHAVRTPAPKGGDVEDGGPADQTETAKKAGAGSGQEPGES